MSRKKKFVKQSDLSMEDINAIAHLVYESALEYYATEEGQRQFEEYLQQESEKQTNIDSKSS